jgi:hypothetical protein
MTDRISEIRARLEGVTPGPWRAPFPSYVIGGFGHGKVCQLDGVYVKNPNDRADATFIANAPADIAYLLDRVEALEEVFEATAYYLRAVDIYRKGCKEHGIPLREYDYEVFRDLAAPACGAEKRLRAITTEAP